MTKTCANCRHSHQDGDRAPECWLNPPVPVSVLKANELTGQVTSAFVAVRPPVSASYVCSYWEGGE